MVRIVWKQETVTSMRRAPLSAGLNLTRPCGCRYSQCEINFCCAPLRIACIAAPSACCKISEKLLGELNRNRHHVNYRDAILRSHCSA